MTINTTQKTRYKKPISERQAKILIKKMEDLGKRIAKQNPGINMTQGIINMRYGKA